MVIVLADKSDRIFLVIFLPGCLVPANAVGEKETRKCIKGIVHAPAPRHRRCDTALWGVDTVAVVQEVAVKVPLLFSQQHDRFLRDCVAATGAASVEAG